MVGSMCVGVCVGMAGIFVSFLQNIVLNHYLMIIYIMMLLDDDFCTCNHHEISILHKWYEHATRTIDIHTTCNCYLCICFADIHVLVTFEQQTKFAIEFPTPSVSSVRIRKTFHTFSFFSD